MIYIFYVLSELKVFLYLTVKFLIYCWVCFYFIVTLPLIWSVMPLIYTLLCPLYTSFVHFRPKYLFLDRFALTVDCISWTCLMPYYILQILKKHYCSKQKTNKFIQHYTFLWFIFCVLRKIMLHLKFPCLYLFSVNSLILISHFMPWTCQVFLI